MHAELQALFAADQAERKIHPAYGEAEYRELRKHDTQRRERVQALMQAGALQEAEDYYHAAMIFQHGETLEEIWQAHTLALTAAEKGYRRAKWLAAAAMDRWLMYQGKPQKYGTQFVPDGKGYRLWELDPATSDAERAAWNVPSLNEQQRRAEQLSRDEPQPPPELAPGWLQEARKRWSQQDPSD
ncbi:hypothetical protein EPA93_26340 [Ktedonosporobacter rubrisoli]|uniref:Uncharacterized protein n=1 Tax=Ktedonosporobacter rubrisoli TaxID=2509675 RepID=A0A4P6JWD5_KTERU|nr:hypothetical protein [Ktedonosporobacter rubrisoli]QBD79316.1 hypothetical protein EPA93_26340 [Ktedonosporobacter rubrisoli]